MNPPDTTAGELLDAIERDAGLGSDAALSRATGVPQTQISKWRTGAQTPRENSLRRLIEDVGLKPETYGLAPRAKLYPVGQEPEPVWAIELREQNTAILAKLDTIHEAIRRSAR